MTNSIRIAIADDHPLFRDGVVHTLNSTPEFKVVGECGSAQEAVNLVRRHSPSVLLLDLKMPGCGMNALQQITVTHPSTSVLILTMVDDADTVAAAFRTGARGYLMKGVNCFDLIEAVKVVASGGLYASPLLAGKLLGRLSSGPAADKDVALVTFTDREEQVLNLLSIGLSNKEIAFRMALRENTVKFYLTNLLKKLKVRNRVEAALYASHRGDTVSNEMHLTML